MKLLTTNNNNNNNNNNNIKKFFMRDRIEDKVAFLLNKRRISSKKKKKKKKKKKARRKVYGRVCSNPENNELHLRIDNERRKNKVRVERRRNKRVLFVSWTDCQVRRRESEWTLLCREGDRLLSQSSCDKEYKNENDGKQTC